MYKGTLRIFLLIPAIETEYELNVSADAPFHDLIPLLREMIGKDLSLCYEIDQNTCFYEKESLQYCDPSISLNLLGIHDGMTFLAF